MTPYQLIQQVVAKFRAGQSNPEQFQRELGHIEEFVSGFAAQLGQLQAPDAANQELKQFGEQCIGHFTSCLADLRAVAQGADAGLCDKALASAQQGDAMVAEILQKTA